MPRLTTENREARRADIVAAARRCFSRDGFHQTSMPDIAAEAGVSTGAPYRYFAGKEEIILEIAGDAFRVVFAPLEALVARQEAVSVGELVGVSVGATVGSAGSGSVSGAVGGGSAGVDPAGGGAVAAADGGPPAGVDPAGGAATVVDAAGNEVPVDELLRCAVQAWSELLRHEGLRKAANEGFERVRSRMASGLRAGQASGVVAADLDVDRATRVVMALLHGFVLQRVAFGLDDVAGFAEDARGALAGMGLRATGG